ncbi:hypothetical protein QUF63_13635 [Anaerolineales bacterium HSG25]|nr:hypothetical protein [Anaerolineales bacterium HSG25]
MKKLLRLGDDYRWNLEDIEFAIDECVGEPQNFIGRERELEYLYTWAGRVQRKQSRSIAFLGRRKVGKSLILERLYNILYSEQKGLIPFYYEFNEGKRNGKEFHLDFSLKFYMQVIGYYTRDISWIRRAVAKSTDIDVESVLNEVDALPTFPHKAYIQKQLGYCLRMMKTELPPYEYVLSAVATPAGFATNPNVEEKVVQMIDEFQYLNKYINAGEEDKPCKAYMSTAESRVAPLLITGSWMGVVAEELMLWLPQRFYQLTVPKMKAEEAIAMTMNYGDIYGHDISFEVARYIVYITNGVPGRIIHLLTPSFEKPIISTIDDVDVCLEAEVDEVGNIKNDWDEYLLMAMDQVNDINMRRITYFLCKNEGNWYFPHELKEALSLDITDKKLKQELRLLFKYDIIEAKSGRYGGIFDRTLKKVLMKGDPHLFNLPKDEFATYFKNDGMLDYLNERSEELKLSLAEAEALRHKLNVLRGQHNRLKGHYYEREVLLRLIKGVIDNDGGLVDGITVTGFTNTLNYHLETGEEIDILLEGEQVVIMAECKNYAANHLHQITKKMVDEFVDKANRLHQTRFADKELRLGFFSKYGLQTTLADYLNEYGIAHT